MCSLVNVTRGHFARTLHSGRNQLEVAVAGRAKCTSTLIIFRRKETERTGTILPPENVSTHPTGSVTGPTRRSETDCLEILARNRPVSKTQKCKYFNGMPFI